MPEQSKKSYIVYAQSTVEQKAVVEAESPEEATQKVFDDEYDDIIDSEFLSWNRHAKTRVVEITDA